MGHVHGVHLSLAGWCILVLTRWVPTTCALFDHLSLGGGRTQYPFRCGWGSLLLVSGRTQNTCYSWHPVKWCRTRSAHDCRWNLCALCARSAVDLRVRSSCASARQVQCACCGSLGAIFGAPVLHPCTCLSAAMPGHVAAHRRMYAPAFGAQQSTPKQKCWYERMDPVPVLHVA